MGGPGEVVSLVKQGLIKGKGNPGTIPGLYDLFTHYNIIPPFRLSNTH